MTATVIICTRNRAQSLDQTLESLSSVVVPPGLTLETIVVDNGSVDTTPEVIQRHKTSGISVYRLPESKPGLSNARNSGLGYAKGEFIVFTDDDLRFPKSWLETMCGPLVESKSDAVAGKVEIAPHLVRPWMSATHRAWLASSERLESSDVSDLVGANMSFGRHVLNSISGFDPELGAGALGLGEETLFALQLRKAKLRIHRSAGPAVLHCFDENRLGRSNWLQAAKSHGRSNAYVDYHWRHKSFPPNPLRISQALAHYCLSRIRKWRECSADEGAPDLELWRLVDLYHALQYSVESRRPRNYEREGLVKICGIINSAKSIPVSGGVSTIPAST